MNKVTRRLALAASMVAVCVASSTPYPAQKQVAPRPLQGTKAVPDTEAIYADAIATAWATADEPQLASEPLGIDCTLLLAPTVADNQEAISWGMFYSPSLPLPCIEILSVSWPSINSGFNERTIRTKRNDFIGISQSVEGFLVPEVFAIQGEAIVTVRTILSDGTLVCVASKTLTIIPE